MLLRHMLPNLISILFNVLELHPHYARAHGSVSGPPRDHLLAKHRHHCRSGRGSYGHASLCCGVRGRGSRPLHATGELPKAQLPHCHATAWRSWRFVSWWMRHY